MGLRRAYARHFVGRETHADSRAAAQDRAVVRPVDHAAGDPIREIGVVLARAVRRRADLEDAEALALGQIFGDLLGEGGSRAVSCDGELHDASFLKCLRRSGPRYRGIRRRSRRTAR